MKKTCKSGTKRCTLRQLQQMKTIESGHFDNLKHDDGKTRIWLSRMTVEDGMPYNNQVTVEKKKKGDWKKVDEYKAR